MSSTRLLYQDDSYLRKSPCDILRVEPDGRKATYVIANQSIFHPKSGGQPSDTGNIVSGGFVFNVSRVMFAGSVVVHWGKNVQGEIGPGPANLEIQWESRYRFMRKHTAAHLFDNCLTESLGRRTETVDSWVGDNSYVGYRGICPTSDQLHSAEEMADKFINEGVSVTARIIAREEVQNLFSEIPGLDRLPKDRDLRVVTIKGLQGIPCGGTHVNNLKEIGKFKLVSVHPIDGGFKVSFDIAP
jgi:alanyl-tRNA synthetase